MSKRLKQHADTLKYLSSCDSHTDRSIITEATPSLSCCFSEICHNKNHLRKIANRKTTTKVKKRLIQKGGFLSALLAPLVGLVSSLFGK